MESLIAMKPLDIVYITLYGNASSYEARVADLFQQDGISGTFQIEAMKQSRLLYHCIPVVPTGDEIRPSRGYGTAIPQPVRDALGIQGDEKAPLIFASDYLSKALPFAFNCRDNEILLSLESPDANTEIAVVCDRTVTMSRPRNAAVFAFPADGFAHLGEGMRHFVSPVPVPFSKTQKIMEFKNVDDLMRAGLQVLSFAETFDQLGGAGFLFDEMKKRGLGMHECFGALIGEGKLVWENHARGINPHPVLGDRMEIGAPASLLPLPPHFAGGRGSG